MFFVLVISNPNLFRRGLLKIVSKFLKRLTSLSGLVKKTFLLFFYFYFIFIFFYLPYFFYLLFFFFLGMICGNEKTGASNPKDWFSRMLLTFKEMKKYPKPFEFNFHLVPVTFLSSFIVKGAINSLKNYSKNSQVFNISNNDFLSYPSIVYFLLNKFPSFLEIPSYKEWYQISISNPSNSLYDVRA